MRSASILSTLIIGLGCSDAFVAPSARSTILIRNDKNVRAVPTSSSLSKLGGGFRFSRPFEFDCTLVYEIPTVGQRLRILFCAANE